MGKTVRERVLGVLQGGEERAAAISVCQYATYELMEKTGAYWPEAHYEAEPMARLAAGGATVIGLGAVRVPYCQTVEAARRSRMEAGRIFRASRSIPLGSATSRESRRTS